MRTFAKGNKNNLSSTPFGSVSYDSNRNLTNYVSKYGSDSAARTCIYDYENRLISVYSPTLYKSDFVYDGSGRMRMRTNSAWTGTWSPGPVLQYIYDGSRVIQERTNGTPTVSYTRGNDLSTTFEGAGGIGGLLARSHGYSAGNWASNNFYFADGNGNVVRLVNSAQAVVASYRYDAFSNAISSSGALATDNVYRFSSKEAHFTDSLNSRLYYYGYRFYDPSLQRWLNRDPINETGFRELNHNRAPFSGDEEANLYRFVRNDPLCENDALGLLVPVLPGGSARKCTPDQKKICDADCEKKYGKGWKGQSCYVIRLGCQIGPLQVGVETVVCRCWKLN